MSRQKVAARKLIAEALAEAARKQQLAAEGYRFYTGEAAEFAAASASAVAEAWEDDG